MASPCPHHLYFLNGAGLFAWLVADDHTVIAAERPVAAWALQRSLADVTAFAARRGVALHIAEDQLVAPVPVTARR